MKNNNYKTFGKYKENLKYDDSYIYSYDTKVAEIKNDRLVVNRYWSKTTTKHVNYASRELSKKVLYVGN